MEFDTYVITSPKVNCLLTTAGTNEINNEDLLLPLVAMVRALIANAPNLID